MVRLFDKLTVHHERLNLALNTKKLLFSYLTRIKPFWFIKLLPENRCHILEEPELLADEQQHIQHCLMRDYSEFDDWDSLKNTL